MYIRIINKNRIANNNTFEDFQKYGIDEGCVYINNYNEELDSFKCRVSNLTNKIDIEPFDRVAIYHSDDTLMNVMDVNTWECTMNGYVGDATYSYDISLFSMTKELENVILPDLSITPHTIGTKLKVYQYIHRYVDLYFTKHRTSNGIATIEYDSTIDTKFNNDAPELQWNAPTLREVLTTLMMTKDCIPVIKWMNNKPTLSYIDLTKKEQPITNYNYIQTSQSADNYVSELRMDMKNVLQTKVNEISNTVTTSEFMHFNCDETLMSSNNFYLETQFPILDMKHLWLGYYISNNLSSNEYDFVKIDLCNLGNKTYFPDDNGTLVYENKKYNTLDVLNRCITLTNYDRQKISDYYSKYQNYCIYYTRGDNKIEGFSKEVKKALGDVAAAPQTTLEWLKLLVGMCNVGNKYHTGASYPDNKLFNSYFSTYFQIEYETQYDQVFQASKEGKQHHRVVADNQTNSWVDATTQGNLEYQKANRLGNEIMLINQRTTNTPIACGDFLGDNIVYKVEQQIYSDFINVNAYATKNYILQDYWTGINSKIRTWVNAQEEAFRRNELKKYYCEFSYDEHNDTTISYTGINNNLLTPIDNQVHNKPIKYVGINTYNGASRFPNDVAYIFLQNCLARAIGKSIVLSFGFNDNWSAGKGLNSMLDRSDIVVQTDQEKSTPVVNKTINKDSEQDTPKYFGGIPFVHLEYTNNGEIDSIQYRFANDSYVAISNGTKITQAMVDNATMDIAKDFAFDTFSKPLSKTDLINDFIDFASSITIYKDNKEIPTINTQFEFTSDTSDIIVTNKWVNLNKWVANYDTAKSYTIYEAPVSDWNCRSTALPSSASQLVGATLETDSTRNNRAKITLRNTTDDKAYYIVLDNEVALAFKGKSLSTDVWLNVLSIRDTNIYNAQGVITGEI